MKTTSNLLFGMVIAIVLVSSVSAANVSVTVSSTASSLNPGNSATFTAHASGGSGNFTYQWFNATIGNVMIPNTNSSTYTFNAGSNNDIFFYYVGVKDANNSSDTNQSNIINITVNATPSNTVSNSTLGVSISPPSSVIDANQMVTLVANTVNGTGPFTFVWELNGNTLTQTTNTLIFNGNLSDVGHNLVTVTVTDSNSQSANAIPAQLTVNNQPGFGAPSIIIPNSIITSGNSESVTANVVNGTLPYVFVWKLNGNTLGQTSNTITFNGNSSDVGNDLLSVIVTDNNGENAIASNTITVVAASLKTFNVSISPGTVNITQGGSAGFSAVVKGGSGNFVYQWYNVTTGTPNAISGANSSGLTVQGSRVGTFAYNVTVTDTASNIIINSTSVTLTVKPQSSNGGSSGGSSGGSGGGGGGAGGGGGSFMPSLIESNTSTLTCWEITNFSQANTEKVDFNGTILTVVLNYIAPSDTGVTINGQSFQLNLTTSQTTNQSQVLLLRTGNSSQYSGIFYLKLLNISYLPILHTVTISICQLKLNSTTATQIQPQTNTTTGGNGNTAGAPGSRTPPKANNGGTNTGTGVGTQSGQNQSGQSSPKSTGAATSSVFSSVVPIVGVLAAAIIVGYFAYGGGAKKPRKVGGR